jgi:hypothetical protein
MARAKRKNTIKIADTELFKLHDAFAKSYAKMKKHDTPAASRGSGPKSTKQERAAFRKWERISSEAFDKARAVLDAPAFTLEGMLMKFHMAGFAITDTKIGTFTGPYRSNIRLWEPGKFVKGEEIAIIVSLRDDLHRLAGRRV